jgi:protein tyrosine/serine phosphatase
VAPEEVVRFLRIVTDPVNHPILVHCQHGADRTGTMVAAYRIFIQGWNPEEAIRELPHFGFHPIWSHLKTFLRDEDWRKAAEQAGIARQAHP